MIYDDITNGIYVHFNFNKIYDLYSFYLILKNKNYKDLYLNEANTIISIKMSYYDIFYDYIHTFENKTYSSIFNECKDKIINFWKLLSNKIDEKKYFINLYKQYMYNKETNITKEKYYITNTNFLEDYFYSYYANKFNPLNINLSNKTNYFKCLGQFNNIFITKDKNNNICFTNDHGNKLCFIVYIQALLYHFINFYTETLDECIRNILFNDCKYLYKQDSNHEIILTNKTFNIKTEYDFFFSIFKFNISETKNLNNVLYNLQEYLKHNGICYYISIDILYLKKCAILYITTTIPNKNFKRLYNNIINYLKSNNYKLNGDIVFSYKSLKRDLSELNKLIKCIL